MDAKVRDLFKRANLPEEIVSIEYLERGYSNICYRVLTDVGNTYKVRFGQNNYVIDRRNELRVLEHVGVGFLYYDPETGDSVWNWIEGRDLTGQEVDRALLKKLVAITEDVHRRSSEGILNHNDMEYMEFGWLSEEDSQFYCGLVKKYAEDPRCLCHNDISLSNLIYDPKSRRLFFIDYEWARANNPYWDYGNFVKEADLDEERMIMLTDCAGLELKKLYEFAVMASYYSVQLSYVFKEQTMDLKKYRDRLWRQLDKYRAWLSKR